MFDSASPTLTITRPVLGAYCPPSWMPEMPLEPNAEWLMIAVGIWLAPAAGPTWLPSSSLDVGERLPPAKVDPEDIVRLWPPPPPWHEFALCAQQGPELTDPWFFGVDDLGGPALPPAAVAAARELCSACPVRVDCLLAALQGKERFGIWAGTTGRQRTLMRASLRKGTVTIAKLVEIYA